VGIYHSLQIIIRFLLNPLPFNTHKASNRVFSIKKRRVSRLTLFLKIFLC